VNADDAVPRYADLPALSSTDDRHCWDFFGRDDELGTLTFLTAAAVAAAAAEVRLGRTVPLSLPLDGISPPLAPGRTAFEHIVLRTQMGRDDYVNGLFLQCASHWDGLRHVRYRDHGYYGGRQEDDLDNGALGIDVIARRGIVGRGVLIDVERHARMSGGQIDPRERVTISPDLLDETLAAQETEVRRGDIVVVRTGWLGWYRGLGEAARVRLAGLLRAGDGSLECPGLHPGVMTAAWLWDHMVSAVAADNPALEALRVRPEEGFLHRRLLPLLGLPIGELWTLDELATACANERRWSFLLTSAPLNIPGGAGSPNNALAVL
jgi:kynurenine formamidase